MKFNYCPECGQENVVKQHNTTEYECTECQWRFWNNAKAAVAGIFLRDDGQALFVVRGRDPQKGKLDLPGGFVDFGESAEAAMAREAMEELGVTIVDAQIVCTCPNTYAPGISTCDIVFVIRKWEGKLKVNDPTELSSLKWKPLTTIESDDFAWSQYRGFVEHFKRHYNTPYETS